MLIPHPYSTTAPGSYFEYLLQLGSCVMLPTVSVIPYSLFGPSQINSSKTGSRVVSTILPSKSPCPQGNHSWNSANNSHEFSQINASIRHESLHFLGHPVLQLPLLVELVASDLLIEWVELYYLLLQISSTDRHGIPCVLYFLQVIPICIL